MKIRRLLKKFHYGEKGFTLIELLVVVAILGILAAVVIPNVMSMMGEGTVQAANTEADDIEIAVLAAMVENDIYELTDGGIIGPGRTNTSVIGAPPDSVDISTYVDANINGSPEAEYTLGTDAHIVSADPTGGKWSALTFTEYEGWSEVTP